MEVEVQKYSRPRPRTPKELQDIELPPFESSEEIPIEGYYDLLEGILGQLKNDIIEPSEFSYTQACSYCRAVHHPDCEKVVKNWRRTKCIREALIRQTWEALIDSARLYNLSVGLVEAFERILRSRDRKEGYVDIEVDGERYLVKRPNLIPITIEKEDFDGIDRRGQGVGEGGDSIRGSDCGDDSGDGDQP